MRDFIGEFLRRIEMEDNQAVAMATKKDPEPKAKELRSPGPGCTFMGHTCPQKEPSCDTTCPYWKENK